MSGQKAIILPVKNGYYEVAVRGLGNTYVAQKQYGVLTREHAISLISELFGKRVASNARNTADECEV